jgi:hypothetical protein
MSVGSLKTFNYVYNGLVLEVTAEDLGCGQTSFTVKCLDGYADINALYWNDGIADGTQFDLGTKKDNSLNMNGTGEDWDGGIKLSSTGLGSDGLEKSTYLTAGESFCTVAKVDWATLDTLGVRATSTSTAEGSIKAVDNEPVITGHVGENLFTENFDGYQGQHYTDNGVPVFAVVDLDDQHGWTGASHTELGADGYGGILDTSLGTENAYWLDTQSSPGQIDISHTFTDKTAAVGGVTSVLSFDIGIQDLNYQGNHYVTDPNASFEFRIDGVAVASFTAGQFGTANEMQHFDIDITGYANTADTTHTLSLVDTSGASSYTGFSVDSIQINDWLL